jgi:hypothetical protein
MKKLNSPLGRNFIVMVLLLLLLPVTTLTQDENGCKLRFMGVDRKNVKIRKPKTRPAYSFVNGGRAISVPEWFAFVCSLDEDVPARSSEIPKTVAMDVEAFQVKIRAHILAAKLEPDNDLHIQIGDSAEWNHQQVVIEIPPGANFCEARTAFMDLLRADGGEKISRSDGYIFKTPPLAEIEGYLFLDSAHIPARSRRSDYCVTSGNRGIKNKLRRSPVRGLWELHPVFKIVPVT